MCNYCICGIYVHTTKLVRLLAYLNILHNHPWLHTHPIVISTFQPFPIGIHNETHSIRQDHEYQQTNKCKNHKRTRQNNAKQSRKHNKHNRKTRTIPFLSNNPKST